MNKLLGICFMILLNSNIVYSQYPNTIVVSSANKKKLGDDINLLLNRYQFSTNKALKGIHFVSIDELELDENNKQTVRNSPIDFYIKKTDKNIYFACSSDASYQNAYYYFLDKIGYKFLGLNEDWINKPSEINYNSIRTGLVSRKINSIHIGYTGGTHIDEVDYKLFNNRNFLSLNHAIAMHDFSPTMFYRNNQREIDLLNKLTPKKPILFNRKFPNLDNPNTLPLIKKWALKRVDSGKYPMGFSVAPADAVRNGMQTEYNPKSIPEIENLYEIGWYVAIEIANYIAKERPNYKGKILMSAYGDGPLNVRPPKFTIPPNMSVQLIPYAFQSYYLTDDEMFKDWMKKSSQEHFSIQVYDYWSPTVWNHNGIPYQDLKQIISERIKVWEKYPINHLTVESTGFKAITLPYLYAFGKYNQNNNLSFDDYLNEYFLLTYGESAEVIKDLYFNTFSKKVTETDLSEIYDKIQTAIQINTNSVIEARLYDLMGYANYLYDYFENQNLKTEQSYLNLLSSANDIKDTGLIQYTTVLTTNYGKIKPSKNYKVPKELFRKKSNKNVTTTYKKFLDNKQQLKTKKALITTKFSVDVDLNRFAPKTNQVYTFKPYTTKNNIFRFKVDQNKAVSFKFVPKSNAKIRIFAKDNNSDKIVTLTENDRCFQFNAKANTDYTIQINSYFESLTLPSDVLFVIEEHKRRLLHAQMKYYFYVPVSATEIIYDSKDLDARFQFGETLMYPMLNDGTIVKMGNPVNLGNGKFKYNVPPQYRGKIWMTKQQHDDFEILNFETIISKQQFQLKQ